MPLFLTSSFIDDGSVCLKISSTHCWAMGAGEMIKVARDGTAGFKKKNRQLKFNSETTTTSLTWNVSVEYEVWSVKYEMPQAKCDLRKWKCQMLKCQFQMEQQSQITSM